MRTNLSQPIEILKQNEYHTGYHSALNRGFGVFLFALIAAAMVLAFAIWSEAIDRHSFLPAKLLPAAAPASDQIQGADLEVAPVLAKLNSCDNWRKPALVDDAWASVGFSEVCEHHEACYTQEGQSWSGCNAKYFSELRVACQKAYKVGEPSLDLCFDLADQYYARAQRPMALRKFQKSQEKQYVAGTMATAHAATLSSK